MINFKVSGMFAAVAFLLSLFIGIANGAAMPLLLVKALAFALLFFAIVSFAKIMIDRYLPELRMEQEPFPGSRVNIMEGDTSSEIPDYSSLTPQSSGLNIARPEDSDEGMGDISSLSLMNTQMDSGGGELFMGMDQNAKDDYTENARSGAASPHNLDEAWKGPSGELSGADGALPDLDSMAGAFVETSSGEETDSGLFSNPVPSKAQSKKGPEWTEDFDPREIAKGIQTVLNKEKEG